MQQTETYKLDLIETSDTFSPAPLNGNAKKLEAALLAARAEAARATAAASDAAGAALADGLNTANTARINADNAEAQARINADNAEAQARATADNALGQRVTALENHQFAAGTYTGTHDSESSSSLKRQIINLGFTPQVVFVSFSATKYLMIYNGSNDSNNKIVDGGFQVGNSVNLYYNSKGTTYPFIAIG